MLTLSDKGADLIYFTEDLPMAKTEQITTKTKIAGYEKEVAQLEQLKDFLHNAAKYADCGVHIPKGVLLYGYPGVGKTVMAKSIADENINIIELRAADCTRDNSEEFIQEAFAQAKKMKPCLLLIDEFDKIAGLRDEYYIAMNDKAMKILLQELDSLKDENGVLVVATCNDIRRLGPALVRSGRFDRIFEIGLPSLDDRKKILSLYFDRIKMPKNLDVDYVARVTSGYSGAQLECLVNESGILAIERKQSDIDFDCFQTAMNRLAFHGVEGEIKDSEKHLVAVHEAGHAIVALYLKPDKVSTATIIPQGQSKGHTRMIYDEEICCSENNDGIDDVAIALGGRVAEIIEFGEASCGCSNDMRQAIMSLNFMITEGGKFGYEYLLDYSRCGVISDSQGEKVVAKRIEILNETHEKVKNIISEHKGVFDKIVEALETKHLLSREELLKMVA